MPSSLCCAQNLPPLIPSWLNTGILWQSCCSHFLVSKPAWPPEVLAAAGLSSLKLTIPFSLCSAQNLPCFLLLWLKDPNLLQLVLSHLFLITFTMPFSICSAQNLPLFFPSSLNFAILLHPLSLASHLLFFILTPSPGLDSAPSLPCWPPVLLKSVFLFKPRRCLHLSFMVLRSTMPSSLCFAQNLPPFLPA